MKHCKFILVAICLCVFLTGCKASHDNEKMGSSSVADDVVSEDINESFYPSFVDYESGKDKMKDLTFVSIGWTLQHRNDYLFAIYGKYIVRYNIRDNKIDKMVDLGESYNDWPFGTSFSADGNYCIEYSFDFSGEDSRNYFLIDFTADKTQLIACRANEFNLDKIPESVRKEVSGQSFDYRHEETTYSITRKQTEENEVKYYFKNEDGEVKTINSLNSLGDGGSYIVIDRNRVGAIMPKKPVEAGALGYYKFVIIDVTNDKIIQECIIN